MAEEPEPEPEEELDPIILGSVSIRVPPDVQHDLPLDRMAVTDRKLLMMSVVAPTQTIKALRAILNSNAKNIEVYATNAKFKRADDWDRDYCRVTPVSGDGYFCSVHRVSLGMAHAMFWSKSDDFMLSIDPEAIWAELSGPRFSTPVIKEWAKWITEELVRRKKLVELWCYNCKCGGIIATTKDLDELVTHGLRTNAITIPGEDDAS